MTVIENTPLSENKHEKSTFENIFSKSALPSYTPAIASSLSICSFVTSKSNSHTPSVLISTREILWKKNLSAIPSLRRMSAVSSYRSTFASPPPPYVKRKIHISASFFLFLTSYKPYIPAGINPAILSG